MTTLIDTGNTHLDQTQTHRLRLAHQSTNKMGHLIHQATQLADHAEQILYGISQYGVQTDMQLSEVNDKLERASNLLNESIQEGFRITAEQGIPLKREQKDDGIAF